uniref:Uncharacterized protein n=1 Tax=Arundo donax TaxID=35708 RepID=A0A0A9ECW9_ARUDO
MPKSKPLRSCLSL